MYADIETVPCCRTFYRHQFLRDGDQLSARLTGTIKVDSTNAFFESFMFARVEQESGKLEWLIERSVWGPLGGESDKEVS